MFCCLLSSGLVWPTSWAILAPSWAILASSWTILAPSGAIRAPSWLPKASQSLPRLNQTIPRGAQRLPELKSHKHAKRAALQIEILVRFAFSFWRPYPIRDKCRVKTLFDENNTFAQKTQKYEHSFGEKREFFFIECNAEIAQKGGPSDTYPAVR